MSLVKPDWIEADIEDRIAEDIKTHISNPHVSFARNAKAWKEYLRTGEKTVLQVAQFMNDTVTSHRANLDNLERFMRRVDQRRTNVLNRYVAKGGTVTEIQTFITDYKAAIDALEAAPKNNKQQIDAECDRIIADIPELVKERLFR